MKISSIRHTPRILLTVTGLISTFPVFAAVPEEAASLEELLELPLEELMNIKIVTASKQEEQLNETPATTLVVTQSQIKERGYLSLIDLLQDLPGVDVQKNLGSGQYLQVALRGNGSNEKFLVLKNGVRINSPTGERIPLAENFPLYDAKQVEVVYGPASSIYGADALTGVVNIITHSPQQIEDLHVATAIGTDRYRYSLLQFGKAFHKNFGLQVSGHIQEADIMSGLKEHYPNEFANVDATSFGGKVFRPANQRENYVSPVNSENLFAELTLFKDFKLGWNHSYLRHPTSAGNFPKYVLLEEEVQWGTKIETAYGNYKFNTHTDFLSGDTVIDYTVYEVAPDSKFKTAFSNFQDVYKYAISRKLGIEQQFHLRFSDTQHLLVGMTYGKYYALPRSADLPFPFDKGRSYSQQEMYYVGTNDSLPIQFLDVHYRNLGGYLQWESYWQESFSSIIGLRYDDNSNYQSTFNPRLGIVYRPRASTLLKLLYGESFRAPNPTETLSHFGSFSGKKNDKGEYISDLFGFVPNPDLQPEKARTIEMSLSQQMTKRWNTLLMGYFTEVKDVTASHDVDFPTPFIPGGYILKARQVDNLGTAHYYGLDLSVNHHSPLTSDLYLKVWGNYSFVDGDISLQDGPKMDLPSISSHKLKLGATLTYQGKYFITPKFYLLDRTNTGQSSPTDITQRLQSPGYGLLDLHLGAILSGNFTSSLDINNVFNRQYYHANGAGRTTFLNSPQPPRSVVWWLEYRF